jgi:hypothetical protein
MARKLKELKLQQMNLTSGGEENPLETANKKVNWILIKILQCITPLDIGI